MAEAIAAIAVVDSGCRATGPIVGDDRDVVLMRVTVIGALLCLDVAVVIAARHCRGRPAEMQRHDQYQEDANPATHGPQSTLLWEAGGCWACQSMLWSPGLRTWISMCLAGQPAIHVVPRRSDLNRFDRHSSSPARVSAG